ncbi:hypothetical protein CRV01_07690 [Arcobacter sp. CECT 8983]|nr:hypothetical protein CRV01_07690 [Arcobacter sp. CECT 8983]
MIFLTFLLVFFNIQLLGKEKQSSYLEYKSEVFYVGGKYVKQDNSKTLMTGQMYVEKWTPKEIKHKYPLVLIHGAAQTAVNWITTPDGRPGWANYFVKNGYIVYMVDQPSRGRSAWHPNIDKEFRMFNAEILEKKFTAAEQFKNQWPQAYKHTQWPGTGRQGDEIFDQFYASQVESLKSHVESSNLVKNAGAALLDKIGPAILITHSQSGPFGWLITDARPDLVKGIVTIEPSGPPIKNKKGKDSMTWGVTVVPMTYEPTISNPKHLEVVQETKAQGKNLVKCWKQKEPAKQLVNLKDKNILFLISESSYHAPYDHCTSNWLTQAGVKNDLVRLEDVNIKGNGHMLMLEKNNIEIAKFIDNWMKKSIK